MSTVQIIVGTVTGNALEAAQITADYLTAKGHEVRVNPQFNAGDLHNMEQEFTIICTSNTGMGDLPANIAPLSAHLATDYPKIAGCKYGVINLGDSSYPNFAQAGRTLDEQLLDLGAAPLIDMLIIDAIYDDDLTEALRPWLEKLADCLQ